MEANFPVLRRLCEEINTNPVDSYEAIKELKHILEGQYDRYTYYPIQTVVTACLYKFVVPDNKRLLKINDKTKLIVTDTLGVLFKITRTDRRGLFFNIYAFLFNEIYDAKNKNLVANISEERKLSIVLCMKYLLSSLSWDIIPELYSKENAFKLGQMLYILLELAKSEQFRTLRLESMECIMILSRVHDSKDLHDIEIRNLVANAFLHFIPGIARGLRDISLSDEKVGHKIIMTAIKTFGRLIVLLMQNYDELQINSDTTTTDLESFYYMSLEEFNKSNKPVKESSQTNKLNPEEMKEKIDKAKRDKVWFKSTDTNLQHFIADLFQLTKNPHQKVRNELAEMAINILTICASTMPISIGNIIEILITLSQDEYKETSEKCRKALSTFFDNNSSNKLKLVTDNFEEMFFKAVTTLPKVFNGFDKAEQLTSLNLILGYLNLFQNPKFAHVLKSVTHLNHLIMTLIHISQLENSSGSLLEEICGQDLELKNPNFSTPWKSFKYFTSDSVKNKLESIFKALGNDNNFQVNCSILMVIFMNNSEHRKEVVLILNEILSGKYSENKLNTIKETINTYLDYQYYNLPLEVGTDENDIENNLGEVQNNVVQICLQIEGIGKIAKSMGEEFKVFLLKTIYPILEKAGCGNSMLRTAGLNAIRDISESCNYENVTELINGNSDYFSYHVIRKLKRQECTETALNVLTIVLTYSEMDILVSIADIIDGILLQTCDNTKKNTAFLRIFDVLVTCLHRWLKITVELKPLKTRKEKIQEVEDFQVSNMEEEISDFSDDIMGKSAEEMFKEDMEKTTEELQADFEPEDDPYKKPVPPKHIQLTVLIINRTLHSLSSKDTSRQILALKILRDGLEVIKDWEDELLPVVHLIWSPLVGRFAENTKPLIVNLCFQLLTTMARISNDFIRSRAAKEILPNLSKYMTKLSRESYLKDKGAVYRYSQAYKLQTTVLNNIGRLIVDLDIGETFIGIATSCIFPYLSDKQPLPLQKSAVEAFEILGKFDPDLLAKQFESDQVDKECMKNVEHIVKFINSCKSL